MICAKKFKTFPSAAYPSRWPISLTNFLKKTFFSCWKSSPGNFYLIWPSRIGLKKKQWKIFKIISLTAYYIIKKISCILNILALYEPTFYSSRVFIELRQVIKKKTKAKQSIWLTTKGNPLQFFAYIYQ